MLCSANDGTQRRAAHDAHLESKHNRRVRKVDFGGIDFSKTADGIVKLPLDREKQQDVEDITGMLK